MDIPVEGDQTVEAAEISPPVVINGQFQVTRGMAVVGADGGHIGVLKDVNATSVLVDRPWRRDVYVPFDAIRDVVSGQLVLTIAAAQVDSMEWPKPSMI